MYSEQSYAGERWGSHMEPPTSTTTQQGQETPAIAVPEPQVPDLESYIVYENEEPVEIQASASADFAAGLLGGCAGLVFGHPFDTVKVRQQTSTQSKITLTKCVRSTFATEGFRGFFRGMAFPLAAVGVQNAIFFGVYGNALRILSEDDGAPSYRAIFVAGGLAGAVQGTVACPIDLVKIQLQAQTDGKPLPGRRLFKGPLDCISDIHKRNGFAGCFRGLGSTILREVPGFSIYITSYQFMCDQMASEIGATPSIPHLLLAGGLAGMISWMINIPIDIVKSRIQADDPANPRYNGIRDCAIKSYRAEGWRVFWRGLPVSLVRAFPTNAVTFAVYSTSLEALQRYSTQRQEQKLNGSR